MGLPRLLSGKESVCQCRGHKRPWVQSLGRKDPLEKGMAIHSIPVFLPGKILWTEHPDELQSMGSQRVRHHGVTEHVHTLLSMVTMW